MSLRQQVKAAFEEADTEKKGAISVDQLCALMKKLTPDLSKADEDLMVSKLAVDQGGMVQIDNFIDVFCGSPPGLRRELSKPIKPEELEVIKEAFKKFDKDGSGKIDVKELAAMCTELGKKMSEQQAMEAIRQLDRNGDSSVDFDEFVLWWTCSPGLGGYSHVALNFMKTKLALKSRAKIALTKIKRVKAAENEFAYNGSFDLTPNYLDAGKGSEEKSSVSFSLKKVADAKEGGFAVTIRLKAKSPDAAATYIAAYDKWIALLKEENGAGAGPSAKEVDEKFPKVSQEKEFLTLRFPGPDASDAEMLEMIPMLEQAVKKFDAKVSFGTSFEQIVEKPLAPLPRQFTGFKISVDALACLDSIAAMVGDAPPPVQAALKLLAGVTKDVKIGFDETSPMLLASRLKEMTRNEVEYMDPGQKIFWECSDKGIETFRQGLYEVACKECHEGGMAIISGGAFKTDGLASSSAALSLFQESTRTLCGIETITFTGFPGSTVEGVVTFDRFNPFILGEYLFGSWPKAPEEPNKEALSKPMKDDEATKLQEIFKKFDKDGSGSIETKELKQIVVELGGTISDEEVEAAMKELDVNGDGSCCFEEFKAFWTSKSGLGGHNSTMLKFLKMKMAAGSMASKGRALLSNAGGFVTLKEVADTVLNWTCEMTPGMAECAEKMSVEAHFEVEDVKTTGPPRVVLVIAAKSEAAAADCLAKINEAFESVRPDLEMQLPALPEFKQDGANIIFSFSPPEELVSAAIYEQADMMKMITPAIKAVKNTRISVSFANSFDDFLGSPDTPAPELFAGAKVKSILSASAVGKGLFFNIINNMTAQVSREENMNAKLGMEVFKMFTGGDITACSGWHKAAVGGLLSMAEEMGLPPGVFCPSGARDFLPNFGPDSGDLPDEIKMIGKLVVQVASQLESVQSLSIENVFLPKEFSQNGLDATIAVKATFENVKPFALANYILAPSLVKAGLVEG